MGEARTVLYTRKIELEQQIRKIKEREKILVKELNDTRDNIIYRKRLLQEILDVYNRISE